MMISSNDQRDAYVWIWLPHATKPIVAGKLEADRNTILFNYGKRYLEQATNRRNPSIAIYEPELPLQPGQLPLLSGLHMPGCIRDAAPDTWGRRVIINKLLGLKVASIETTELSELTYLLESGSDRMGSLDFQQSATEYVPRVTHHSSLDELQKSAELVMTGQPLSLALDQALLHGSSIGGARPKALFEAQDVKYIAKFSANSDLYSVVKAEFIAMRLAELIGLNVAPVKLTKAANKDVLLVERFDRVLTSAGWTRKAMVSALTLFGLNEMMARYASYTTFSEIIRHRFTNSKATLHELFSRLVFNILCGNTDDHARNHAAFWDGKVLQLTPAYDICPQGRSGFEASQAMLISGNNNLSQLKTCLSVAPNFLLSKANAIEIFAHQESVIREHFNTVCDQAELSRVDRQLLFGRQFLNRFALEIE